MKINFFMLLISLIIGGLVFYGFYAVSDNVLYSIIAASLSFVMLASTMAFHCKDATRSSAVVKVVSGIFFILVLLVNILLVYWNVTKATFIITNGVILCIWAIIAYVIGKTKQ